MFLFGWVFSFPLFPLVLLFKDVRIASVWNVGLGAVAFVTVCCCTFLLLRYCYTHIAKDSSDASHTDEHLFTATALALRFLALWR